jgi:hypothetical protein
VSDPSKTSLADYDAFASYVDSQPDLSTFWSASPVGSPVVGAGGTPVETLPPLGAVQVVAFTGDIDQHRAAIANLWGGPVCVVERTPSKADLMAFQQRLQRPDVKAAGVEVVSSGLAVGDGGGPAVAVQVLIDDAVTRAWFAANARSIPVTVTGVFQPVG